MKIHKLLVGIALTSGCILISSCAMLTTNERELIVERRWVKDLPLDDGLGAERFHGMSPLLVGEVIYQGNGKDSFSAYDRKSGARLWTRAIENGVGSGAAFLNNTVYVGASDGQFYALNSSDGSIRWSFPVRQEVLAPPVIDEGVVYFLTANNVIYALDTTSGKQKWLYNRTDTTTFSIRGGGQPLVNGNQIYIGFSDGFFVCLNKKTGALVWERNLSRNPKFKDVNASAVIDGNAIYISSFDDALYKLSLADGQIIWRIERGGHTAVTINGSLVYYATTDGELLALDKVSGDIKWSNKVSKGVATQPVMMNELLVYSESRGDLKIVNSADGKAVANFTTGHGNPMKPTTDPAKSEVYFVSNNGNLYALKLYWQRRAHRLPWE